MSRTLYLKQTPTGFALYSRPDGSGIVGNFKPGELVNYESEHRVTFTHLPANTGVILTPNNARPAAFFKRPGQLLSF